MEWETVIGLEVHVQLSTQTKIFSGASTQFGAAPNTQACALDLGLPGTLPVLNEMALYKAVAFGVAIGAEIGQYSAFDRKNYFYPDLPKGYQITQMDHPIVGSGHIDITLSDGTQRTIGVTRAHLEEDAGKSLHEDFAGMTGVDLNRAGTPLLEIVSEPDLRSAEEAVAYLKKIHSIITAVGVSDGNMAEGSMRCDANISVRRKGDTEYGTRCEIKNVNSFRFVERAILFEVDRQIELIESGHTITQETRLYDPERDETRSMRSKEIANDYRYFPEPDLLPVVIDQTFIDKVRRELPELPDARQARFSSDYGLSTYDAGVLVATRETADFFEQVVRLSNAPKLAANWVMGDLTAVLNRTNLNIQQSPVSAEHLAQLIARIQDNTISSRMAKNVFEEMVSTQESPDILIDRLGLKQVSDTGAINQLIDDVIAANPQQLADFKAGKDKLFGFFVGQVMKQSKGQANPELVNQILREKLSS
jgi:aspartyl-tRNA(Asn)/glutamyl-tRNA(Gln) amidotransferase subunit B